MVKDPIRPNSALTLLRTHEPDAQRHQDSLDVWTLHRPQSETESCPYDIV